MTPKKFIIAMCAWLILFVAIGGGIFGAAGIADVLGGGNFWQPVASGSRVLSRSSFWIWLILMPPCIFVSVAGTLAGIVLPVYIKFRIPMRRKGQPYGWLGAYIKAVERMLQDEW
jgi:hypothetical protein